MAAFDLTRVAGALKRVYDKRIEEVLYSYDNAKLNPGFVSLTKTSGQKVQTPFGAAYAIALKTKRSNGSSADYATAETISNENSTSGAPGYDQFLVTPSKYYSVHRVEADVLERATDEGAFIKASAEVVKDALQAHMRRLCILSHGTGSGKIASIIAAPTTTTITVNKWEVRNIERGDKLVVAAAEASGALRVGGALRVTGRDPSTGIITLSADPSALSWASGDSIFWEGDRAAAGFDNVYKGYMAWSPSVVPTGGESFFGVDRSVDSRLGGLRLDCSGKDMRELLIDGVAMAVAEGAMPDRIRLSITDFASVIKESDDLKTTALSEQTAVMGFKGVTVVLPASGPIEVLMDESMPDGSGMVEVQKDWQLLTINPKVADIVSHDGLVLRKVNAADAYAVYVKSQIQPVCRSPGHQVRLFNIGA